VPDAIFLLIYQNVIPEYEKNKTNRA
jgi:hypothetical protein